MSNASAMRLAGRGLTRRDFLHLGAAATAVALVPGTAAAAPPAGRKPGGGPALTPYEDPYAGVFPLVFPLAGGAYRKPLRDNWHDNRDGEGYDWSHQNGSTQRAHDGVDIFPRFASSLPPVFAPRLAQVAAINIADGEGAGYYTASEAIAPPWGGYAQQTAIYGSFIWLRSLDDSGRAFFIFYCHLQSDDVLRAIQPGAAIDTGTRVGTMGETGNAVDQPQLHMEIHLPAGSAFDCVRCKPQRPLVTAVNPFPSLSNAKGR